MLVCGTAGLTKNANLDKNFYSGYGIGFHSLSLFSVPIFYWVKNIVIFEVDNNTSTHIDNKEKYKSVLGKGPTQGLGDTTITAEAEYSEDHKENCLSLHYSGSNNFLFANATKIYESKQKNSKITPYPLCLENIF